MNTLLQKNRLQLKLYSLLVSLFVSLSVFSQNVSISSKDTLPNAAAGLDVYFSNKGLLIPRIALTGTANFAPLSAHVAGMIVYNTAIAGDVKPGFYYDNGTKWITGFPIGGTVGDMLYWDGTTWILIPVGTSGQYLQLSGANTPSWTGANSAALTTNAITSITATSATSGGNAISDNGSTILSKGICYATTQNPTTGNTTVVASPAGGTANYSCNLTGLTRATTYYVRAYATNSAVTTYANQLSFITLSLAPTLATTTAATLITATTATTGGNVTDDGGSPISERGICFGLTNPPTTANTKVIDPLITTGSFASNISGLNAGTTYYVRSYATNGIGTNYGAAISFMTLPSVTSTTAATAITATSASTGGVLAPFQTLYNVYYYGVAYSTTSNAASPTKIQTGTYPAITGLTFVQSLTGLTANTLYYIRAYATTSGGTVVYGPELNFTTSAPTAPVIASTTAITGLSANTATSGGTITSDGGSAILAKGVCWSTSSSPILGANNFTSNGTGTTAFASNITGLTANTAYYVRAYATNSIGTSYGPVDVTFTTWMQAPYTIGQDLGYGWCAYVDPTGHGFIVSYDIPFTGSWGCSGTIIGTTTGTAIGTGLANTNLILANCATRPIAASVAQTYTGGGFSDWYLPSSGEWQQILNNRNLVGLSYPNTSNYYTSTEQSSSTSTYAVSCFFNASSGYISGATKTGGSAQYIINLRAIRNF